MSAHQELKDIMKNIECVRDEIRNLTSRITDAANDIDNELESLERKEDKIHEMINGKPMNLPESNAFERVNFKYPTDMYGDSVLELCVLIYEKVKNQPKAIQKLESFLQD